MSNLQKHIKDLIFFYVKTNYENHLKINNIQFIPDDSLEAVISSLYDDRKEHLQELVLDYCFCGIGEYVLECWQFFGLVNDWREREQENKEKNDQPPLLFAKPPT